MSWERYKNTLTGIELRSKTGDVFYPRSYCDDPTIGPVGIYTAKAPVCKLKLTPRTQFANTNIAWDISQSVSSTSTLSTFDITWGGTTDIGDLVAQAWSGAKTGNVQFTTPGTYTISATVTDLLGTISKTIQVTVNIISATQGYIGLGRAYIGTTDGGLYTILPGGDPVQQNDGLTGNHINFRSVRINSHFNDLPITSQHLWAATQDGVAYTVNGATGWNVISKATLGTPENAVSDSPAPATADLDQIEIWPDPQDYSRIYLLRTTATRSWLYYTDDYGSTWTNQQVVII